jgi:hypothetical protein
MALNLNTGNYTSTDSLSAVATAAQQAALLERPQLLATLTTLVHLLVPGQLPSNGVLDVLFKVHLALTFSDLAYEDTNQRTLAIHELLTHLDVDALVDYVADLPTSGVQENAPVAGLPEGPKAPRPPVAGRSTRNSPAPQALQGPAPTKEVGMPVTCSWKWLRGYLLARIVQARKGRTVTPGEKYPLEWWLKTCAIAGIRAKAYTGCQPRIQVLDRDGTTWLTATLHE